MNISVKINSFRRSELGASLVEYAVALIIVTLVGGSGVLAIGGDAGALAGASANVVNDARTSALGG